MKHSRIRIMGAVAALSLFTAAATIEPIRVLAMLSPQVSSVEADIAAIFPFEGHFIEVNGAKMHFVDEGEGAPILLVHGNPTSSYLWRNVIPHLTEQGRVIAVDLIGMGKSAKPAIDYRFTDHAEYLDAFIEALDLQDITLVLHDWGGALGLDYFAKHSENVTGIVLMEAVIKPASWSDASAVESYLFNRLRAPSTGPELLGDENLFIETLLPMMAGRTLSDSEMAHYRGPYTTGAASRAPIVQWPLEIPFDGIPADNTTRIGHNFAELQASEVPTLVVYGEPGLIFNETFLANLQSELPRAEQVGIGAGLHYLQETQPTAIGRSIAGWLKSQQ